MKKLIVFMWSCLLVALFVSGCGGGGGDDDHGNASSGNQVATVPTAPPVKEESSAKAIVAFAVGGVNATVTGQQVQATVPYGTNVRRLVATFKTTGERVSVDGASQISGVTAHDFSMPVSYVVTADDGSTATYVVTVAVSPSQAKAITAFSIGSAAASIADDKVAITLPYGTDRKAVVAAFNTTGESVTVNGVVQKSGVTVQDFSVPMTYIVKAADGSTASYVVTVLVAPSQAKAITAFSIAGVNAVVNGKNIAVILPSGMGLSAQVASFTTTGASVTVDGAPQVSGTTSRDFSKPVAYTVVAADGSTASYNVTVSVAPSQAKAITAFSIAGVNAAVNGRTIAITLPSGTSPTAQVASFTTTGASVTVDGVPQISGTTSRDFSKPVTYTVVAADGSTASYNVTVSVAPSQAKALTTFSLGGVPGTISGSVIAVTLPAGSDLTNQIATFTTTGASVSVKGVTQASGSTPQRFDPSVALPYIVHAADGSTASYEVIVTVAKSSAKAITSYTLDGEPATIYEAEPGRFVISVPYYAQGRNGPAVVGDQRIYELSPTFTTTGTQVTLNGVPQTSGPWINIYPALKIGAPTNAMVYVVTAEDGSTAQYWLHVYPSFRPTPLNSSN